MKNKLYDTPLPTLTLSMEDNLNKDLALKGETAKQVVGKVWVWARVLMFSEEVVKFAKVKGYQGMEKVKLNRRTDKRTEMLSLPRASVEL